MAENDRSEYIVPVVSEELHADAVRVETGSVRVVKRVETSDEVVDQELRKGRVEVKRVETNRVVDGPQASRQVGNTLIIPVVSEVLQVQKSWIVTEEIHVTQIEERETVQQTVPVNREVAEIEHLDKAGKILPPVEDVSLDSRTLPGDPRTGRVTEDSTNAQPDRKSRPGVRSILKPTAGH